MQDKRYCVDCKMPVYTIQDSDKEVGAELEKCCVCGSDDLANIVYCEQCEEPKADGELREGLCSDCIVANVKEFQWWLDSKPCFMRTAINVEYEGKEF